MQNNINQSEQDAADLRFQEAINGVNALMGNFPDVLASKSLDKLMEWFKEFTDCSNHMGIVIDHGHLIAELMNAGYVTNDGVGEEPGWFNTRDRMGRYIVGQVMDCLSIGMPPHPVASGFIDDYFKLPEDKVEVLKPAKCFDVHDLDITPTIYTLLFADVFFELTANDTWYKIHPFSWQTTTPADETLFTERVERGWKNCYHNAESMKTFCEYPCTCAEAVIRFQEWLKIKGVTPEDNLFVKIWW